MIRPADDGDLGALVELEHEAFGQGAWSAGTLREEIALADRIVLVDERDGVATGYVDVGVVADVADLHRVVVAAAHRRHGVASSLVGSASTAAADRGATRMLLEVADDNAPALALYDAHGFEPIARRRGYYGPGRDALVLEASLPASRAEPSR